MSTIPRRVDRFLKRGRRFWLFPTGGIVAALVVAPLLRRIDAQTQGSFFDLTPQGATAVLTALSTAMFTFVVFVISSLLLVVQLASQPVPLLVRRELARHGVQARIRDRHAHLVRHEPQQLRVRIVQRVGGLDVQDTEHAVAE